MNADYAFASAIYRDLLAGILFFVITYDIACQWARLLSKRLSEYEATKQIAFDPSRFRFAIPKFHLIGHGKSCNLNYNLAFMRGVGMTHGETVETIWSHSTTLAISSRENGLEHATPSSTLIGVAGIGASLSAFVSYSLTVYFHVADCFFADRPSAEEES